jgi:hypothetical protein
MVAPEDALIERDPTMKLLIRTNAGDLTFTDFSPTTSKGKPLAGNAVLTSRMSKREDLRKWRTADPT